ncbi:hypothetical protein [Paraburkholderia hospita]|uniref:hypothetical protein n=1 Tax=Paraburkholderia hospita TaxID=169430 RepID=UPI000B345CCA|nr:hypothetical protein [Paraburkholderia hospita]
MEKSARSRVALSPVEVKYNLELARGASVIASTLTEASLMQAVGETLSGFVATHGTEDLDAFVRILGERLNRRDRPDAAKMICSWQPFPSKP